jgi:hypothetical protein
MSDDLSVKSEQINSAVEPIADEEFEEISSDEVDRVVAVLDELIETVLSENIQAILEDASNSIFSLVYDENDLEEMQDEAA